MVDAAMSFRNDRVDAASPSERESAKAASEISVVAGDDLSAYAELCAAGLFAPAQSAAWIGEWVANARPDSLVAIVKVRRQTGLCAGRRNREIRAVPHRAVHERPTRQRQFPGRRSGLSRLRRFRLRQRSSPRSALRGPTSTYWRSNAWLPISTGCPTRFWRSRTSPAPICRWQSISPAVSTRCFRAPAASASARSTARRRASSRPPAAFAASRRGRPRRPRGCSTRSSP